LKSQSLVFCCRRFAADRISITLFLGLAPEAICWRCFAAQYIVQ